MLYQQVLRGGLGITVPVYESCRRLFDNSIKFTWPPILLCMLNLLMLSAKKHALQQKDLLASTQYDNLFAKFPGSLKRSMEVASELGASSWLSAIPIHEYGFAFTNETFMMPLHYGWQPCLLPSSCVCDQSFTVEHATVVDFPQFIIMSRIISQHHYSLRYAMQWEQYLAYNLYLESSLSTKQPMMQMKLV